MLPLVLGLILALQQDSAQPSLATNVALDERLKVEFPEVSRVIEHELENGWRFLLLPREGAPVVSFETYVAVGSIDERPGGTGLAHLFEHMAFKGSDRVGTRDWPKEKAALEEVERVRAELAVLEKGNDAAALEVAREALRAAQEHAASLVEREEFSRILEEAGGGNSLNASTSADETRFVVSLPSNQLELWCWMERERFERPVLRELYSEREAILEERRLRIESNPFGSLLEALQLTAFQTHPYRHPIIGFREDIEAFTAPQAREFFQEYYGTRNRITAIIGDFEPEKLIPMLERICGKATDRPAPDRREFPREKQNGTRRVHVEYAAEPLLALCWHIPALTDPFAPAFDLVVRLLGQGPSSRLESRLVRTDESASQVLVEAGWPGERDQCLAVVVVVPTGRADFASLESALLEEVSSLAEDGPTAAELAAAKATARADLLRSMRDSAELASLLLEFEAKTGDWREAFRWIHKLEAMDASDIQRALQRWFTSSNMTVATLGEEAEGESR